MSSGPSSVKSPCSAPEVKQSEKRFLQHFICDAELGLVYCDSVVFNDASWILLPRLQLRFRLTMFMLEIKSAATNYSLTAIWGTLIMSTFAENKDNSRAIDMGCKLCLRKDVLF